LVFTAVEKVIDPRVNLYAHNRPSFWMADLFSCTFPDTLAAAEIRII
jgi:hypothetical protein